MNFAEILELLKQIFDTKEQIEDLISVIGDNRKRRGLKRAVMKAFKAKQKDKKKALRKVRKWLFKI